MAVADQGGRRDDKSPVGAACRHLGKLCPGRPLGLGDNAAEQEGAAPQFVACRPQQFLPLTRLEVGPLAGGPGDEEPIDPLFGEGAEVVTVRFEIELAVFGERRHQRRHDPWGSAHGRGG